MDFLRTGFYYAAVPADLTDRIRTVAEGARVVRWHALADCCLCRTDTRYPSGNAMVPWPHVFWRVLTCACTHTLL